MRTPAPDLAWITWLKAVGMLLIVYGHVAAWAPGVVLPPINTKQLGVAFFVFASGYTLASDRRPAREIIVRRLFEVLLLTAALALAISGGHALMGGNLQESNFLPLLGGINVLFESFPANPTSWYVGTYIHIVILGALTRRLWSGGWRIVVTLALLEIAVRAMLVGAGLRYIPYMLLSNWLTVYGLGHLSAAEPSRPGRAGLAALGFGAVVSVLAFGTPLRPDFPFWVPERQSVVTLIAMSAAVTGLYAGFTLMAFVLFKSFARTAGRFVRFISDHTLAIFLGHMPVLYTLRDGIAAATGSRLLTACVLFLLCVYVPALVSSILRRLIDFGRWKEVAVSRLCGLPPDARAAAGLAQRS